MSAFQALNIDYSQVAAEQEVDDTKELQIEDALKLYQSALKYHAEGPQSYDKAIDAYKELFESDIFKYPESQTELARSEQFPEYEDMWIDSYQLGPAQPVTAAESAPNTLPQIIYLSYKNHGRFMLHLMQWRVQEHLKDQPNTPLPRSQIVASAQAPLGEYAKALDKDDTDIELWRSGAVVAQLIGCSRIARFCLEAVLDMGEESLDEVLGMPNVEQTLAMLKLKEMSQKLKDDLTILLAPLPNKRQQRLGAALVKKLDSHISIPQPTLEESAFSEVGQLGRAPMRYMMMAAKRDWAAVGEIILQQQTLIESGMVDTGPGVGIGIQFPELTEEELRQQEADAAQDRAHPKSPELVKKVEAATPAANDTPAADEHEVATNYDTAPEDTVMADGEQPDVAQTPNDVEEQAAADEAAEQPAEATSRKRSTDSAELPEDEGRGRSKRMRKREVLEDNAVDTAKQNADWQLNIYRESDEWLFNATNTFLQKLEMPNLVPPLALRGLVTGEKSTPTDDQRHLFSAVTEFYELSTSCTVEMGAILSNGLNNENIDSFGAASRDAGFNSFLSSSASRGSQACIKPALGAAEGLARWTELLNAHWKYPREAAWEFLTALLKPGSFPESRSNSSSSYITHRWSDELKRCVVQLAVRFDEDVYSRVEEQIERLLAKELKREGAGLPFVLSQEDKNGIEFAQTMFELHLDVYSLIKRPGTNVDDGTKTSQKDRLERWSALANAAVNLRTSSPAAADSDDLELRHIWATAFHISVCDEASQAHVLNCMKDLKALLTKADEPVIHLQNNAVIPQISMAAIEQELSKINMKDFFAKIFSHSEEREDPVETIESLEPLLEGALPRSEETTAEERDRKSKDDEATEEVNGDAEMADDVAAERDPTPQEQMVKFLSNSTWSLRLSLWQRLRQAYKEIDYLPKVASCHFRSIELLTNEMLTAPYAESSGEPRKLLMLRWFHLIDEFAQKLLYLHSTGDIFECVDAAHLRSSASAIITLIQMLHGFFLYEDQVRVGSLPSPTFEGRVKPSFVNTARWMHNFAFRLWMLLYRVFQEAIEQDPEGFETPAETRFEYLRTLHYTMGQRKLCYEANKDLLRLLLDEALKLSDCEYSDIELTQIVYDLYGLRFAPNPNDLMEHGCTDFEVLNRSAALKLLGFFMSQAQKVPMKDMPKSEIKSAVDKVQGALGKGRSTDDTLLNSRVYSSFMKSTVNPLDLFAGLRGTFEIPMKPIPDEDAPVASKGWFSLLGLIALSKFRSVKRLQPGPCEDLMIASAFFRQDIEYCSEHWESWYRLAQVNDLQLEEHVSWSAEKINNNAHEIFHYQRQALHAYNMAMSTAFRSADNSPKTVAKVAEMYADFGNRIYQSTREPFSMLAFGFQDKEERHFSGEVVYQRPPFNPLQPFAAWRFAATLFRRSIARAPEGWASHFMLGKCLWKMFNFALPEGSPDLKYRPSKQNVVDCFVDAVKKLPNRDSRKEPILEPHYKLVSIVHKLYKKGDLTREEAQEALKTSSYAAKVSTESDDSWIEYVQAILKPLRSADKSGWHHRMTARAAHLVYDDAPTNPVSAMEAKSELTQQMFTKTMVLQVWKPEFERPGRHFVYTTRYVRFFVQILAQLGDRESLSALLKRLRRKPDSFYEHGKLWQESCLVYLKLLRRVGQIPEGYEDAIFKSINHEEFAARSAKLEHWCHTLAERGEKSTTYEVLCDVIELKKVNNGLMKATLIDDLLGDTYAKLYEEVGPERLDKIQMLKAEGAQTPGGGAAAAAHKPMALTSVMNLDGAADAATRGSTPQTEPAAPGQPGPVHKSRTKGVGRREIQRKAEAATNRPVTAASSMPIRSNSIGQNERPQGNQLVGVIIPSTPRQSISSTPGGSKPEPAAPGSAAQQTSTVEAKPGTTATASAAKSTWPPTNPYASANPVDSDDESELSELDEEPEDPREMAPARPLFPSSNVGKSGKAGESAGSSVTIDEVAEDEEEGEEEEEGSEEGDEEEGDEQEGDEAGDDDGDEKEVVKDEDGDERMEE